MVDKQRHPVRNGIVATVVGGIILSLILPLRDFSIKLLKWLWVGITWGWRAFVSFYPIPGWVLMVLCILALVGTVTIYRAFRPQRLPEFQAYTEDMLYGAKWRWSWIGNNISNLWCFCPRCDAQLIYDDSSCRRHFESPRTDFICERCNNKVISTVPGGNKSYAVDAAEREILRRIRTNEYKKL